MCGRITQQLPAKAIADLFQAELLPGAQYAIVPRYNVAPSQQVLGVVTQDGARRVVQHRWGLVPAWAKDPAAFGNKTINARAETVAVKPSYRDSFQRRRSIIPIDAFYEWQRSQPARQPYAIVRRDGGPLAIAGLWAEWRDPGGDARLQSCAVITTTANEVVGEVHFRMPVLLPEDAWDLWLDPSCQDVSELEKLLRPCPNELLRAYPVSKMVGNVRNDGPELLLPAA